MGQDCCFITSLEKTYKQVHTREEKYNQDLQLYKGDPGKESEHDRVHRPPLPPDRRRATEFGL
jgi:hypothetical protein